MDALADLGVEGFNVYFKHMQPHLLQSRLRPMPAMADTSTDDDLALMNTLPGAIIEASITPFAAYGQPLHDTDLNAYRTIAENSAAPSNRAEPKALCAHRYGAAARCRYRGCSARRYRHGHQPGNALRGGRTDN